MVGMIETVVYLIKPTVTSIETVALISKVYKSKDVVGLIKIYISIFMRII